MSGQPIKDEKGLPGYTTGETFFDGSQIVFNTTPGEECTTWIHKSGSSVSFKMDGTVSVIAAKDLHVKVGQDGGGVASTVKITGDLHLDVSKELHIKCAKYDLDGGVAIRENAKAISIKAEKEFVQKANDLTTDVSNRTFLKTNAYDTEYNAQKQNVAGPLLIENDTGIGFKMTNPKGGIWFESAGFMDVKVAMNYNTEVQLGDMSTTVMKGMYDLSVPLDNIYIFGKKIFLN